MYTKSTVKKSLFLLVAVLICATVFLSACDGTAFKGVTAPTHVEQGDIVSNGGMAVKYGEWLYFVNGYESSASADNTYVETDPRIGSVVRIKFAEIENLIDIAEDKDLTSSKKNDKFAELVREKAETVVPKIYYSANTTTAALNGIYIFNDRLYMLTPNDQLTAGGNTQTDQLVLTSFTLDGKDEQRHFVFTNNAAQIWLYQKADGVVMATYVMNSKLYVLDIANDEKSVSTQIGEEDDTVTSVNFDEAGQRVFFISSADNAIYQLLKGEKTPQVVVKNDKDWEFSYSISSVNNGYVYYSVSYENNSDVSSKVLYYAKYSEVATQEDSELTEEEQVNASRTVALNTTNVTAKGWKDNWVVVVNQSNSGYYGISLITGNASATDGNLIKVLLPGFNDDSITLNKIVGDMLYYTAGGVTYVKDLSKFVEEDVVVENAEESKALGVPYAASMSTSTSNWALPDIVTVDGVNYMFTFGTGTISVVKFDADKKTNSNSAALTFTAESED